MPADRWLVLLAIVPIVVVVAGRFARRILKGHHFVKLLLGETSPRDKVERMFFDWLEDERTMRSRQRALFRSVLSAWSMPSDIIADEVRRCVLDAWGEGNPEFGELLWRRVKHYETELEPASKESTAEMQLARGALPEIMERLKTQLTQMDRTDGQGEA